MPGSNTGSFSLLPYSSMVQGHISAVHRDNYTDETPAGNGVHKLFQSPHDKVLEIVSQKIFTVS